MKKFKWILILNLLLLLLYYNYSVYKNEQLLRNGKLVLLELAPVDPRSLMQGDYMDLRYEITETSNAKPKSKRGYCVVKINEKNIAKRARFQADSKPLNPGEFLIKFTSPDPWTVNIGAESYFFQEGEAEKFEKAKYGALKIDEKGNSLLFGLYDENLNLIQ